MTMREKIARIISNHFPETYGETDEQIADAVLDAMREPTQGMVKAGRVVSDDVVTPIWHAMIDAARGDIREDRD